MPDEFRLEFGSQMAANEAREEFEDYLAGEPDRRTKTAVFESDVPEFVEEQATGRAAVTREERATDMPGVALSDVEKEEIDFSEVSPVEARQAKAKAAEQGVGDFLGAFDPTLTVSENKEIFEQAARETSGGRDARRSVEERQASAFKRSESEMMEHAREGVRHGSKQAEQELRRRGVSESEIQQLKQAPAGGLSPRTEVLFPDVGEVTPQEWATAKRSHEHRRVEAQNADEGREAQTLTTDVEKWRQNKNTMDFPGVDSKSGVGEYLEGAERDEFADLTQDLWTWQR